MFIYPLYKPVHFCRKMITTKAIERYNHAAVSILENADSPAVIWTSINGLTKEFYEDISDGLHIPVKALEKAIQVKLQTCFLSIAHRSRRGPRLDLSYQQKFQQIMKIRCLGFHKMYKRKKSAEGPTLLMLGF